MKNTPCSFFLLTTLSLLLGYLATSTLPAEENHIYAISGARIHPVAGPTLESGTILFRDGRIEAVGVEINVPREASIVNGKGLDIYPGLIDMSNSTGLAFETSTGTAAREAGSRIEAERLLRQNLLRPQLEAASLIKTEMPEWKRSALQGITSLLAVPAGEGIKGRSALVNTSIPEDPPQISRIADERRGLFVLRSPVALHVSYPARGGVNAYPASLMGVIAFIRQAFLDAGHYHQERERALRGKVESPRSAFDAALEGLYPALAKKLPVIFEAGSTVEISRALTMAREFDLEPVILGGLGSAPILPELKARKVKIIYSLNFPVRPKDLAPEADESLQTLRARADAPKVPLILQQAGIPYAFASAGLKEPGDFLGNLRRIVKAGLPAEDALRASTLQAARMAGVEDRLGSLETGKMANLLISEGSLFEEKSIIRYVFIDGRLIMPDSQEVSPRDRRSRGGR